MRRDENDYEIALFEADYTGKTDCETFHAQKRREITAVTKAFLKTAKHKAKAEESLLKAASSCNTLAAITGSRLLFWCYEGRGDEVAFVLYNTAFTMEDAEVFYLLSTVSVGATASFGVSDRFPDTLFLIISVPLT